MKRTSKRNSRMKKTTNLIEAVAGVLPMRCSTNLHGLTAKHKTKAKSRGTRMEQRAVSGKQTAYISSLRIGAEWGDRAAAAVFAAGPHPSGFKLLLMDVARVIEALQARSHGASDVETFIQQAG